MREGRQLICGGDKEGKHMIGGRQHYIAGEIYPDVPAVEGDVPFLTAMIAAPGNNLAMILALITRW